jgi:hypothetical protein
MKKKIVLSAMLVCLLVLGLTLIGCPTDSDDDFTITKLEGKWVNPIAIINYGYSDFSFTFTGNKMLFNSSGNNDSTTNAGTFTFTDDEITFIPGRESTWTGYTQKYTLQDDVLQLESDGEHPNGPFQKQDDNLGAAPFLTGFITVTEENGINGQWVPDTSFSVNDNINVGIRGYDLDGDVRKLVLSAKLDGSVILEREIEISGKGFTQFWGSFKIPSSGNYAAEVYAVDAEGNQSNVLSTALTVEG